MNTFLGFVRCATPVFCFQRLQLQAFFALGIDMKDKSA